MNYYLAVDIGASSGRHMIGWVENGTFKLEEIYRFENKLIDIDGEICWDIENLWIQIKNGVKECKKREIIPISFGIDTWAVDFVLLDEEDNIIGNTVAYRDSRTDATMNKVFETVSMDEIYKKTGIQFQKFNTLYQLMAVKEKTPHYLEKADKFLMIPDYINYLLTGKSFNEYTNATSTQLLNAYTKQWDMELIDLLGINKNIFQEIIEPTTPLGNLKQELIDEFGFDMEVIVPATHDTGSAFIASPVTGEKTVLISSGTWSLMGVELEKAYTEKKALEYNFTNEGGVEYKFRFLKNIMGLWIIQEVKRNFDNQYSFAEIVEHAENCKYFETIINVNDERFLKPHNMVEEILKYCKEMKLIVPKTLGEIAYCVFNSLVNSYKETIENIEELLTIKYDNINIFGGGCQNVLINRLLAEKTGKTVYSGPIEATAIGNLICQMIGKKEIKDVKEGREIIKKSFNI